MVSGPSGVLIQAGGSIGLPEASRAYQDRGWKGLTGVARVVAVAGIISFVGVALVVALWGETLLSHIYGPKFAHLGLVAVLFAIAYIFQGFALGPILVIKATRQTHWLFIVQAISLAVSVVTMVGLCLTVGVTGAALAMVITYAITSVAYRWCQHRVRKVASLPELTSPSPITLDELNNQTTDLVSEGPGSLVDVGRHVDPVPREAVP